MDKIVRRFRSGHFTGMPVDFFVYRKDEADAKGIEYKEDWREAQPGDWVLTDDDWVGELIYRKPLGKDEEMTFSFAKQVRRGSKPEVLSLHYEPYRLLGSGYNLMVPVPWDQMELKSHATQLFLTLWARMTIARKGRPLRPEDINRVVHICWPSNPRPDLKYRHLMKSPLITKMAEKRVDEVLEERGITMDRILDEYEWALKTAKSKEDVLNVMRIVDRFSELKQKYHHVEEMFDEDVEAEEEESLERAPEPKRLDTSSENGV